MHIFRQVWYLIKIQYLSCIVRHQFTHLLCSNQQFRTTVLQHKMQSVLRIRMVKRLAGTAAAGNTHRTDCHIFTAGNQHSSYITCCQSPPDKIARKITRYFFNLTVCISDIFIYNGCLAGIFSSRLLKHIHNRFAVII